MATFRGGQFCRLCLYPCLRYKKQGHGLKEIFKKFFFSLNAVRCKLTRKDRTYSRFLQFTLFEIFFHSSRQNFIETVLATKIKDFTITKVVFILENMYLATFVADVIANNSICPNSIQPNGRHLSIISYHFLTFHFNNSVKAQPSPMRLKVLLH